MAQAVGNENIFIFGLAAADVDKAHREGYDPHQVNHDTPSLAEAIDMIRSGFFSAGDDSAFQPLLESLFEHRDRFMVLADFPDFVKTHHRVAMAYQQQHGWTQMSLRNVAHAGPFSCDRMALTYAREIWNLDGEPVAQRH
jgi:starch phosphorylase